jgi:hypothetical protein
MKFELAAASERFTSLGLESDVCHFSIALSTHWIILCNKIRVCIIRNSFCHTGDLQYPVYKTMYSREEQSIRILVLSITSSIFFPGILYEYVTVSSSGIVHVDILKQFRAAGAQSDSGSSSKHTSALVQLAHVCLSQEPPGVAVFAPPALLSE